jgi:glycosyltransferase involved in cell wall biosynthesis
MMSIPKVSFVLPTYNYAQYLRTCVDSILEQDYTNLEVVIVDDASCDETPTVAETLCREDSRVRYFRHEQNVGPVNNWNASWKQATGELVWLMSADDALAAPHVVSRFVKRFQENPSVGFVFCRAQIIDENNVPQAKWIPRKDGSFPSVNAPSLYPGHTFFKALVKSNFVPVLGTMARKICYDRTGGFVPDLIHCGDWYNWLRFCLYWDVFYEPEVMASYRVHTTNLSRNYSQQNYPVENTLLCYRHLRAYIREQELPTRLLRDVDVAEILFRRQKNLPRTIRQRVAYRMLKLAGQL